MKFFDVLSLILKKLHGLRQLNWLKWGIVLVIFHPERNNFCYLEPIAKYSMKWFRTWHRTILVQITRWLTGELILLVILIKGCEWNIFSMATKLLRLFVSFHHYIIYKFHRKYQKRYRETGRDWHRYRSRWVRLTHQKKYSLHLSVTCKLTFQVDI